LRVRVEGLEFKVEGFRIQGLWFRSWGSGFRVEGLGFRDLGSGFSVKGSGFMFGVHGSECRERV